MKKIYIQLAGIINLITALVHLIAGQKELVNPLLNSNLKVQQNAEWIGVWHIVTVLLFFSSHKILKIGFSKYSQSDLTELKTFGLLYILVGIPFIMSSIYYSVLAPQWTLLMPIGILLMVGLKKLSPTVK